MWKFLVFWIHLLAEFAEDEEPVHLVHKRPEVSFLSSRRAVASTGDGPSRAVLWAGDKAASGMSLFLLAG